MPRWSPCARVRAWRRARASRSRRRRESRSGKRRRRNCVCSRCWRPTASGPTSRWNPWSVQPGRRVSHAELAHAHLAAVWRSVAAAGDEAVLALPGSMRLHQAGLLLGIARHVGVPVAGVVDAAVAATAGLAARADVLHLDVQLHQAVLTVLEGEAVLRRKRVEIAPRAGLKPMFGAWAQLVSEAMVRRTRFDPLHQAGFRTAAARAAAGLARRAGQGANRWKSRSRAAAEAMQPPCGASSSRSRRRPGTRSSPSSCARATGAAGRRRSRFPRVPGSCLRSRRGSVRYPASKSRSCRKPRRRRRPPRERRRSGLPTRRRS